MSEPGSIFFVVEDRRGRRRHSLGEFPLEIGGPGAAIQVVAAEAEAEPRKLTSYEGSDSSPAFTPDGSQIMFVRGGDPADVWYDTSDLAIVSVTVTPAGTPVANHAFDVTPARLVTGLITERGVCGPSRDELTTLYPDRAVPC